MSTGKSEQGRSTQYHVFVSYSRRDSAVAKTIVHDLRVAGLRVWFDEAAVKPGERIRERIAAGIDASASVLVLCSKNSLKSAWVVNELDQAMLRELEERQTIVIPVLLGSISPAALPGDLRGKRWIDLRFRFASRYRAEARDLVRLLQLAASAPDRQQPGDGLYVPDLMDRILSYRYRPIREKFALPGEVIDALATQILDLHVDNTKEEWRKEVRGWVNSFKREYGKHGLRQLGLFAIGESGISWTGGFTEKELGQMVDSAGFLLMGWGLRTVLLRAGLELGFVLDERQKVHGFMVVRVPGKRLDPKLQAAIEAQEKDK